MSAAGKNTLTPLAYGPTLMRPASRSPSRILRTLVLTLLVVAGAEAAQAQCRLYRKSATATAAGESVCATVSCDSASDVLVACGLGPQTSKDENDFVKDTKVVRSGNTTCEACGYTCGPGAPPNYDCTTQTIEVEVTCIAPQ